MIGMSTSADKMSRTLQVVSIERFFQPTRAFTLQSTCHLKSSLVVPYRTGTNCGSVVHQCEIRTYGFLDNAACFDIIHGLRPPCADLHCRVTGILETDGKLSLALVWNIRLVLLSGKNAGPIHAQPVTKTTQEFGDRLVAGASHGVP